MFVRGCGMAAGALAVAAAVAAVSAEQSPQAATVSCPAGWSLLGVSCYQVSPRAVTGALAGAFCSGRNASAAVVETQGEMDALRASLLESTVYLGVNIKKYRENLFSFLLKMSGHTGYTNFHAGEPDSYGAENCVVADAGSLFAWRDVHCSEVHPVLCKAPAELQQRELTCEEGAHLHGASTCFWADVDHTYVYAAAAGACEDRGMTVASVHSPEENDFLYGLTEGYPSWIGLTDEAVEGEYVWSDGTSLDYENWLYSEPTGGNGTNCVHMFGEGAAWYDTTCAARVGVVCRGAAK